MVYNPRWVDVIFPLTCNVLTVTRLLPVINFLTDSRLATQDENNPDTLEHKWIGVHQKVGVAEPTDVALVTQSPCLSGV